MKGMLQHETVKMYERDVATFKLSRCMKGMLQHETVKMYERDVATFKL